MGIAGGPVDLLLYGGSFDPPHVGHLAMAKAALGATRASQMTLIPAAGNPLKMSRTGAVRSADPDHRLAMCKLLSLHLPGLDVSDYEILRPPPSYTLHTLRHFAEQGHKRLGFLMGADQLASFHRWHQPMALLQEATFFVVRRPGYDIPWQALPDYLRHLEAHVIDAPLIEVSSSDLRLRIATGKPVDHLLTPEVSSYIHQHRLYQHGKSD